jgi:uncharacterized membrane protein YidH (DUF202 family)
MSEILRREVVFAITGIVTVVMFLDYFFFAEGWIVAETLQTWAVIIINISLLLGGIRLWQSHGNNIQRRGNNWQYSALLMIASVGMLLAGLMGYIMTGQQSSNYLYMWIFTHIYTPLGATLYAITGFYIFSAAYRAFRARNIDAALMLIAGCFVILSNAPIGEAIWVGIADIGQWFRFVGQVPGMRTFAMVGALGMIAYGFRALLGRERGFYAGGGGE